MAKITETGTATCNEAFGKSIESFEYEFEFPVYESYEDMVAANDLLSNKEVLAARNAKLKAAARAEQLSKELEKRGIKKPTLANDADLRVKEMAKIFVASGKSEADAMNLAKAALAA